MRSRANLSETMSMVFASPSYKTFFSLLSPPLRTACHEIDKFLFFSFSLSRLSPPALLFCQVLSYPILKPNLITILLQEHNLEAVDRLLTVTNLTKSSFLDRLFLRRQKHSSGIHASRLWYVDLDTWMAGTTGAGGAPPDVGAPPAGGANAAGGACSPEQRYSVVADDEQTHCALSGEKFDQFWDEDHQEWRYKDAKKLTAEEGASYGLEEGAIVLVSALGSGPQVAVVGAGPSDEEVKKEEEDEGQGADAKKEEDEGPAQKRIKRE